MGGILQGDDSATFCPDCENTDLLESLASTFIYGGSSSVGNGKCSKCRGDGTIVDIYDIIPGTTSECDVCSGTGQCQTCGGEGVIKE